MFDRIDPDARVLVVDDNEQNVELMAAYLDELGCHVDTAHSGAEALARMEAAVPDVVILDIMMPQMSGFQLCERLRRDERFGCVSIIMVTALNEMSDVERSMECGADDFLTKPVHRLELVARVRAQIHIRRLQRRLDETLEQVRALSSSG